MSQLLPILGSKAKYVRENAVGTSYTLLAVFRGLLYSSIFRFCTTTSDTTAYTFGLALFGALATAAVVDTACCAISISGFCTTGTASTIVFY